MENDYSMEPFAFGLLLVAIFIISLINRHFNTRRQDAFEKRILETLAPKQDKVGVTLGQRNAIQIQEIRKDLARIPGKVLDSVTSSGNNQKGRLGELIGYLKLNAQYDKIIAFSDVTDFIGIKWPTKDSAGTIDFIDIKNGPHAKLTRDQTRFKKLIEENNVKFIKVKVDTNVT